MGRSPCCSREGAWTGMILSEYIRYHCDGGRRNLPPKAGLKPCGKGCRLGSLNYLPPDIKRGTISSDEEELIIRLHRLLGNRWSLIAGRLPGRTDNEIMNYWNTYLSKKRAINKCQAKTPQNLQPIPESPPPVRNHVVKTIPVKTKAVRYPPPVQNHVLKTVPVKTKAVRSPPPVQNHVFKTIPVKTKAVRYSLECSDQMVALFTGSMVVQINPSNCLR